MKKIKRQLTSNKLLLTFLLILPLLFVGTRTWSSTTQNKQEQPVTHEDKVKVIVKKDAAAPLQIVSFHRPESAPNNRLDLELQVKNIASIPISSYAIRYEVRVGNTPFIGVEMSLSNSPDKALKINTTDIFALEADNTYSDAIKSIYVSVDFVELTDGTTWGRDSQKFSEYLSGFRAGAKESFTFLSELMVRKGAKEVATTDLDQPAAPENKSERWKEGFTNGQVFIKQRLDYAYKDGGEEAAKTALNKPIDALGTIENISRRK